MWAHRKYQPLQLRFPNFQRAVYQTQATQQFLCSIFRSTPYTFLHAVIFMGRESGFFVFLLLRVRMGLLEGEPCALNANKKDQRGTTARIMR